MTNTELFDLWRARAVEDPDLLTELDGIRGDADAINDRFYRDLAFGTGRSARRHRRRQQPP